MLCLLAHAKQQPNIILFYVDDLGWSDLSVQGSKFYETPHLDKLASQGMRFTNAYAGASNCAPSRACLMLGQYTPRHGVFTVGPSNRGKPPARKLVASPNAKGIKAEHFTMAEALQGAGYATIHLGKWHISSDPTDHGFDINIAGTRRGGPYGYQSPFELPNLQEEEAGIYLMDRIGDEAVKFLDTHQADAADQPFFMYYSAFGVHLPLDAKANYTEKFMKKPEDAIHENAVYAAMIYSLDENIGKVIDHVEKLGIAENTLIVFTSDNGGQQGLTNNAPLRGGKGSYFEGGIREPFFVKWKGEIGAGMVNETPISQVDLFPTFLEAAAAETPPNTALDGVSLLRLWTQNEAIEDRALFWHFPVYLQKGAIERDAAPDSFHDEYFRTRPGSAIRYGDWKLHEYFEYGRIELYNLKDDIGERNNLADQNPEKAAELHAKLKSWREAIDAPVPTELNPEFIAQ